MTLDALNLRDAATSCADATRIVLSSGSDGSWLVSRARRPATHFNDFEAALAYLRDASVGEKTTTVEIWQSGEYVCCLPPRHELDDGISIHAPQLGPSRAVLWANRAARILFTTAGPLFWLALVAIIFAASLD